MIFIPDIIVPVCSELLVDASTLPSILSPQDARGNCLSIRLCLVTVCRLPVVSAELEPNDGISFRAITVRQAHG